MAANSDTVSAMTSTMRPYRNFNAQTAEALSFYQSIFGGELTTMTFAEAGALPAEHPAANQIMHGDLSGDIVSIMASDAPEGVAPVALVRGNDTRFCLQSDDLDEGRAWFERLGEGGEVEIPFGPQIWGDTYGSLTDRFGTIWAINVHVKK